VKKSIAKLEGEDLDKFLAIQQHYNVGSEKTMSICIENELKALRKKKL